MHTCIHACMHRCIHAIHINWLSILHPFASLRQSPTGFHLSFWQEGWGLSFMMQQASFHNMPIAFASAKESDASYAQLGRELQSALTGED